MRPSLALVAVGVVLVIGGACTGDDDDSSAVPDDRAGEAGTTDDLSEVTLPGLGDNPAVAFAAYEGRPVVVNFFASTCAPCVQEMPAFEAVNQAAGGDVAFVGVAVNDRAEDALARAEETGVTWDLAADPDGTFIRSVGGVILPTTVLLDAEGRVVEVEGGELEDGELVDLLAERVGVEVALG